MWVVPHEDRKDREKDKKVGKKLGCFMVFFTLKEHKLPDNLLLIFTGFWWLVGCGSGASGSSSNHGFLSLVTYFSEITQVLCLMIIVDFHLYD